MIAQLSKLREKPFEKKQESKEIKASVNIAGLVCQGEVGEEKSEKNKLK